VNGVVSKRINSENLARKGDSKAAINPRTVMGAITGATKIFAGTVTGANCPESKTITGMQNTVALIGIASASTIQSTFKYFRSLTFIIGEKINIPAVAKTDNAKPGSTD
jgi:hypothetical protein